MRFLNNRTIVLVLLAIPLVYLISLVKANSSQAIYKVEFDRFWTYKVHSKKKFDMMVIGDSRVYRGISPQAINKVIPGISICNFGFSSGKINNEIFYEAEKRLKSSDDLKFILIGITPVSLIDEDNEQLHEILKMTNSEIFDKIYTNYLVTKYISPLKPDELFRSKSRDSIFTDEIFYDNGWVSTKSNQTNHYKYLESYRKIWETKKVSQKILDELYAKINAWTKENIQVYVFRVPSSREMDNMEDELSGINEADLLENVKLNGGYWICLADKSIYRSYDGSHLDDQSASLLSTNIALEINKVLNKAKPDINN